MSKTEALPTVLLVDDEPGILSSLQRTLRKEGYRLLTAPRAEAALQLMADHPNVLVVVSDQRMPGRSGIAFLGEVARRWPRAQRILLSGWSGEIPAEEIAAASLLAVLAKPWDDDELKRTIAQGVALATAD